MLVRMQENNAITLSKVTYGLVSRLGFLTLVGIARESYLHSCSQTQIWTSIYSFPSI